MKTQNNLLELFAMINIQTMLEVIGMIVKHRIVDYL